MMMRWHSYKNKPGGYWRGVTRSGRFRTVFGGGCCGGCLLAFAGLLLAGVAMAVQILNR